MVSSQRNEHVNTQCAIMDTKRERERKNAVTIVPWFFSWTAPANWF